MKPKRTVVLDFDDTLVKSSEEIIRQLNRKNHTDKTIEDLKDWNYKSIDSLMTEKKVFEMYSDITFFENVKLNDGVKEFFNKFYSIYHFVICSKGDKENLRLKEIFCKQYFGSSIEFIGIEFDDNKGANLDKSCYDFFNTLFCVDDNTSALQSINSPKKILLKNNREVSWNRTPINDDNIIVVNSFYDIIDICEFDEKLKKEGIILG